MTDLPVGTTTSRKVIFTQEDESRPFSEMERAEVLVTERDWDVTDPAARAEAFRAEVGEGVDGWWLRHAQWFIDAEKNAAALAVYRRKTPENLKDWQERKQPVG